MLHIVEPRNPSIFALWSAIILPILCFTMYGFSLYLHQVDPILPYISDSAGLKPQSALFTMLTVLISITIAISGHARYRQLHYIIESLDDNNNNNNNNVKQNGKQQERNLKRVKMLLHNNNLAAIINLYLSMVGVILIGTYSVRKHIALHCLGVFLMCLMSVTEACHIESYPTTMFLNWAAQFLSGAFTVIFALASAYLGGMGHVTDGSYRLHWVHNEGGYSTHVLSAAFEWVTVHYHSIYMLCLWNRMRKFPYWDRIWLKQKDKST